MSRFTFYVSSLRRYLTHKIGSFDPGLIFSALLTLFIIQNLLQPGLPAAADVAIHLYRTMEYKQAWAPGVIAPRWAPNLAFGYGYPLFVFAPPLPYFLALLFHLLGFSLESALKLLLILTIALYATGMYLLVRDALGSVGSGLVAAVAYTFAPFALREALLYGGNAPQFLAISLFPWTLWAMSRAARSGLWGWGILAAIFYAGVLLSHLFQALVFTPVVALYGLILFIATSKRFPSTPSPAPVPELVEGPLPRSYAPLLPGSPAPQLLPFLTIPLGLLLSAFSWLPAFVERFYTRAQSEIYLEKSPFFVRYPHWSELVAWIQPLDARAANPYVPLTLGVVTLILAGLGLLAGVWLLVKNQIFNQQAAPTKPAPLPPRSLTPLLLLFFALIACGSAFMSLPASRQVWETVSILQVAEFPWRMLGLTNLGLAFLAGAVMLWLPQKTQPVATAGIILIQIVAVAPLLYPVTPFAQYGQANIADQIAYERSSQSIGTTTLGEYLPRTVERPPTTSPLVEAFQAGRLPERLDYDSLPVEATASLLKQNAVTHNYQLDTPTPFTLRMFHFDYPGWRAWLDDRPVEISPEPETGLMLIDIPAGQHILTIHFGETPLRVAAMALTALTILGIAISWFWIKGRGVGEPGSGPSTRSGTGAREPGSRGAGDIYVNLNLPDSLEGGEFEPIPPSGGLGGPKSDLKLTQMGAREQEREGAASSAVWPAKFAVTLLGIILLSLAAFWFKPLLRPFFTIHSPPGQALPAQHAVTIEFEQGIHLIGYDLSQKIVAPGEYFQVVLYWATNAAPHRVNLQPFVHLDRLDNWTTIADATNYTPGDVTTESNIPTFHWDNARYARDEHDLTIPPQALPLAYAVRVGLIDPDQEGRLLPLADGSGDTAQLTIINVAPKSQQPARLANQLDATFSNQTDTIRLTGFELDSLTPERLDFRLSWRSEQPLQGDYTVFAQLLDLDQNLATSFDRPPLDGAYPTSTWLPNQTIVDPRYIPLQGVAPGSYRLITGLYDSANGQRLMTASGSDFVELTTVVVGE